MPVFNNDEIVNGTFTDPTDILFIPNGVTALTLSDTDATFGVPLIGDGVGLTTQPFKLNLTTSNLTGTLTETIIWSALIPAGTFDVDDTLFFYTRVTANNSGNTKTFRVYFNTTSSLVSAEKAATVTATSNSAGFTSLSRHIVFKNSLSSQEVADSSTHLLTDYNVNASAISTLTVDFSVDQYIIISGQLTNTGDTAAIRSVNSKILR